jgi:hypothetical protein
MDPLTIGAIILGILGVGKGIGAVAKSHREAKAQTDPFIKEKREVIKRLLQTQPFLPDVSYSDFVKMLEGEEEGKKRRQKGRQKGKIDASSILPLLILNSQFASSPLLTLLTRRSSG